MEPWPATLLEQVERLGHYPKCFKEPTTHLECAENPLTVSISQQWSSSTLASEVDKAVPDANKEPDTHKACSFNQDSWSWNTSSCWGSWHSEPWHNGTCSWNTRSVWDVTETQPSERWTEMHHYNYCGQSCPCCRSINPEDVMGTCKICDAGLQEIKSGHAKQNLAFQHDELLD